MFKDGWFFEDVTPMSIALKVKDHIYSGKSKYQKLDIIDTESMGKVLLLDDILMTTEKDEFYYHESISHIALSLLKDPKNIMIIGGGDGGTAREVLKYSTVENIDMVEIDEEVINVSKKYLPEIACEIGNPKLQLKIQDAIEFVKNAPDNSYDAVLCDCTDPDPDGIAEGLISTDFYKDLSRVLKDDGIYIAQSGSPILQEREFKTSLENMRSSFKYVDLATSIIPTYPGSLWAFLLASNSPIDKSIKSLPNGKTKYWNKGIQEKVFECPNWIKEKFFSKTTA